MLLVACARLPEPRYETDRLRIATDFDERVCRGTLDGLDRHVSVLEAALGVASNPNPISVYWQGDVTEQCGEGRTGCFFLGTRVLFATGPSIKHELLHAVLDSTGETYFIEEGLAEFYSGDDVYFRADPTTFSLRHALGLTRREYTSGGLDYRAAAHFMGYVYRSGGEPWVRRLAADLAKNRGPNALQATLEELFDRSLAGIEADYLATAPTYYAGLATAEVPELSTAVLQAGYSLRVDCKAAETHGPLGGELGHSYRVARMRVEPPGGARVQFYGDPGSSAALFDPVTRGAVTNWAAPDEEVDPGRLELKPGTQVEVELERGDYLLLFRAAGGATDMQLQIEPRPEGGFPPVRG